MRTPSDIPSLTSAAKTEVFSAELGLMMGGIPSDKLLLRLPVLPSSLMSEENRFVRNGWEKSPSLSDDGRLALVSRGSSSLSLPSWIPLSLSSSMRVEAKKKREGMRQKEGGERMEPEREGQERRGGRREKRACMCSGVVCAYGACVCIMVCVRVRVCVCGVCVCMRILQTINTLSSKFSVVPLLGSGAIV